MILKIIWELRPCRSLFPSFPLFPEFTLSHYILWFFWSLMCILLWYTWKFIFLLLKEKDKHRQSKHKFMLFGISHVYALTTMCSKRKTLWMSSSHMIKIAEKRNHKWCHQQKCYWRNKLWQQSVRIFLQIFTTLKNNFRWW